jgi:hypothetical protein
MTKNGSKLLTMILASTTLMGAMQSEPAFANTGLEGKYKYLASKCGSGAAPNDGSSALDGITAKSLSSDLIVTSDKATVVANISLKMDEAKAAAELKDIQALVAFWNSMPDSTDKTEALKAAAHLEDLLKKLIVGVSCTSTVASSYSVQGPTITSQSPVETSNCPEPWETVSGENKIDSSQFKLEGNVLTITSSPFDEDSTCPKGDVVISTFEKLN